MKPTEHYDDGVPQVDAEHLHNPDVAHEHDDVNVRGLVTFGAGMVIVTGAVMVLMWGLFIGLERLASDRDPDLSPMAMPSGQQPPEPRLLTNEPLELQRFREREAQTLAGGQDPKTGATRMSIDDAMRQVAAGGVPARSGEADDPRRGTRAPSMGESSGGRTVGNAHVGAVRKPPM
jgi:hypothetical protein